MKSEDHSSVTSLGGLEAAQRARRLQEVAPERSASLLRLRQRRSRREQPAAGEASPWIAKTDDEGDVYYVNTRTQQIQARWPRHKRATMHHTLYTVYRTP